MFGLGKIKPLKLIGKAVQVAAPVALTIVGGPIAGVISVASGGSAAKVKKLGQMMPGRPHKVGSPAAVVGLPAALQGLLSAVGVDGGGLGQLSEFLASIGLEAVPPWLAVGLFMWLSHQLGNNIENSGR